jgi:mannose-6-phosphate isomerase-like protein (cupin superfamily)
MTTAPLPFDLFRTVIHLEDGAGAVPMEGTRQFWEDAHRGKRRYDRLMSALHAREPDDVHASMWEVHPERDEIVFLIAGGVAVILDEAGRETVADLHPGEALIVPRGVWHRLRLDQPSDLLFVNCRTGSELRPVERS